ncbi:MAG: hypothetical protein K8U03_05470 [Planctomycetia bacterium]|nr:hypothetical protein [Planctomycetia bacterium]
MSELFHTSGSMRAYPSRPIPFADFETFVRRLPETIVEPFRDSWDDQRDIAVIDKRTGDVELIAAQLGSDHVGFYVRSSPSRRIQRLVCEHFGVDIIVNRLNHRLDFIMAETASLHPMHAGHFARP